MIWLVTAQAQAQKHGSKEFSTSCTRLYVFSLHLKFLVKTPHEP